MSVRVITYNLEDDGHDLGIPDPGEDVDVLAFFEDQGYADSGYLHRTDSGGYAEAAYAVERAVNKGKTQVVFFELADDTVLIFTK